MKPTLAIIGSGIAGMGAAWYLKDKYQITVFEKNDYIGGHTNTLDIQTAEHKIQVDTGFIVYNLNTYPNLIELFDELGVETIRSNMSFSVWNQDTGLQWCGSSYNQLFAQRRNIFSRQYWSFLSEANRFNKEAPAALEHLNDQMTLQQYLQERGHTEYFTQNYIVPMAGAIWSTPVHKMLQFPVKAMILFFRNHGLLGMNTHYQWWTVKNGARNYMDKIRAALPGEQRVSQRVNQVREIDQGVELQIGSERRRFDRVIIAAHADEALAMLESPDREQAELLSPFRYEVNMACLHSDTSVMPTNQRIWAAWNTKSRTNADGSSESATVYDMNRLQDLPGKQPFFVSINEFQDLDPDLVHRTIRYEHPLFNAETWHAQKNLAHLNKQGPIYFCGSYFRYGFHEDALWSAKSVARRLLDD
ncbi:MAG: FAD-dependent oxidoreductase [Leptospiraceae bacterium]|nr:FAD-dependent oxidoreductase [Leptospiraceae bacterium]